MKKFSSSRSGQSIIEAMVAISILSVGFLGVLGLLAKSFQLNRDAQNQTKATYLASEGIELVKNLIDHDIYSGIAFNGSQGGWENCFPYTGTFYIKVDYSTYDCSTLNPQPSAMNNPIYFDATTGLYGYSSVSLGATRTIFTRDTIVTVAPNEIDVTSIVYWTAQGVTSNVTLQDHFYNWHPSGS